MNNEENINHSSILNQVFNQNLSDKEKITNFLKSVITLIEKDECSKGQYKAITEFYISFFFEKFLDSNDNSDINYSEKELQNFLCLGWYIYSFLLKKV